MKRLVRWLYPGLRIKRWMLLFSAGLVTLIFGMTLILNYQFLSVIEEKIFLFAYQLTGQYNYAIIALCGVVPVLIGAACMLVAVRKLAKRIIALLVPEESGVSEQIVNRVILSHGPRVAAVGGGHGLSMLLRGLKTKTSNLTAVVTVADDGGSSGRLREEMGIIAPGDLRNCLVAMADKESLLEETFQYRFSGKGELAGHSLGNLFLAALIEEFGNAENALKAASRILNVRGQVIPSTTEKVRLSAVMSDGAIVVGESEISAYPAKIVRLSTIPAAPAAVPSAAEAIREADLVLLGPGSLYTSILPNLLIPDIAKVIREGAAPCVYICNVMTQPGETDHFTVSDHLKALIDHIGPGVIDFVLANNGRPAEDVLRRYAAVGAWPVAIDEDEVRKLGVTLVQADLLGEARGAVHDAEILSGEIIRLKRLLQTNLAPELLEEYLGRKS